LKEASLEFGILYDTEDADFQRSQRLISTTRRFALFVSDGRATGWTPTSPLPGSRSNRPLRKP
jgi:hypothetical protein